MHDEKNKILLVDSHVLFWQGLRSAIKSALPRVKIIVLSVTDRDGRLVKAIERGADGALGKNVRAGRFSIL